MNSQQKYIYQQKHIRRYKRFERIYVPLMKAALEVQVRAFVKVLRSQGQSAALSMKLPERNIVSIMESIYEDFGLLYAKQTLREIDASVETKAGFGINEELISRIIAYLTMNILRDTNSISNSMKDEFLKIINKGVKEGWGIDRMAREIETADFPFWRARMNVRTELVKAMNAGQQVAKDESDFETVDEWVSADDARVRNSHLKADGQRINNGEKFAVPRTKGGFDMMTGPGDPTASAENVINCRCTKTTRAARDEFGRIIRKRKISVILPSEIKRPSQTILI